MKDKMVNPDTRIGRTVFNVQPLCRCSKVGWKRSATRRSSGSEIQRNLGNSEQQFVQFSWC